MRSVLLLPLSLLALSAASTLGEWTQWELSEPKPAPDDRADVLDDYEEIGCVKCHTEVAKEWAGSHHALSWVNEPYQEELADMRRPKGCWGCHVPEPLHLAARWPQKPPPREDDRHYGVTCATCHVGPDETILGPWGAETDAHASVKSEHFGPEGKSALCITCHATNIGPVVGIAKDFEESDQASKGLSCVGCHMAPVERPAANDPDGETTYPARHGRSHALQTPRDPSFLRRAFELEVKADGGTTVVVSNACGHRVPGLVGRRLTFTIEVLDASGAVAGEGELVLDRKAYLPVDEPREVRVDASGAKVRIRGTHEAFGLEAPVVFLDETRELGR